MAVYLIAFAFIFGVRLIRASGCRVDDTKDHNWLIMAWVVLSLIEGFRAYSVGTDTRTYVKAFENQNLSNFDLGFQLLNRAVALCSRTGTFFLLVTSFIITGLIIRAIDKMSRDDAVSLFIYMSLYMYFNAFNAMRQYIAVGLVMNAYVELRENRNVKFTLLQILAILFHNSAIVGFMLIPMYLFFRKYGKERKMKLTAFDQWKRKQEATLIPLMKRALIPVLAVLVFSIGFNVMLRVVIAVYPKYSYYLTGDYAGGTAAIQQKVVYSAFLLVYLLFSEEEEWLLMVSYAVALALLMSKMSMLSRFIWYFDIFVMFAVAEVWHTRYISWETLTIVRICIGLACFAFMLYYLINGVQRVTPYQFIFLKNMKW